jgi:hypothetical protein
VNRAAWWTDADRAELAVLIWELVTRVPEHKTRCARCQAEKATGFPCPAVTEAIEAVLDWRRGRQLLSRAEWLRARQAA